MLSMDKYVAFPEIAFYESSALGPLDTDHRIKVIFRMALKEPAFIRTMCFLFPFIPLGIVSVNLLQGMGKGLASFIVAVLWNVVCIASCTYLLAIPLGLGEQGAWWGIVLGVNSGAVIAYGAVAWFVERVNSKTKPDENTDSTGI